MTDREYGLDPNGKPIPGTVRVQGVGTATDQRYRLLHDESGHQYVIPIGKEDLFEEWVTATENGDPSDFDFEDCRMNTNNLTFTNPQGWK